MGGKRANPPVLKRLGQHFLTDRAILEAIAAAVAPADGETVVEIGPGRGALTDILASLPNKLVAVEIDRALSEKLRERYATNPRVNVVEGDVLEIPIAELVSGPFVVVGNVPYYITTPILFHVLRSPWPRHAVFLVQREVADRIVAGPGSKTYGALTVNIRAVAHAEILRNVPASAFSPPPKVTSALVRVTPRVDPIVSTVEVERFRRFVLALFGMRRKQIANSLRTVGKLSAGSAAEVLAEIGIDPQARAEMLSPGQLAGLMRAVAAAQRHPRS